MVKELKLCPFCGGKAELRENNNKGGLAPYCYIECIDCKVKTKECFKIHEDGTEHINRAYDAWNARPIICLSEPGLLERIINKIRKLFS